MQSLKSVFRLGFRACRHSDLSDSAAGKVKHLIEGRQPELRSAILTAALFGSNPALPR